MTVSMPMDFVGYLVVAEIAAVAAVIAVVAPIVWAVDRLNARRKRVVREREGRRDGYVTDGDLCRTAACSCLDARDTADGLERLIADGRIDPYGDRNGWAS